MITEILEEWGVLGLAIGLCTFLIIGIFHPIVIKSEYHWGVKCWWVFALLGAGMCAASIAISDLFLSVLFGVVGFSSFWTILELFEQRERVRKGWFPANPKKQKSGNPSIKK